VFNLFPNPVENSLTINLYTYSDPVPFVIINSVGQKVHTGFISALSATIKVEDLESGVYYVQIQDKEEKMLQKFIKK